jgi:hypothetical protein
MKTSLMVDLAVSVATATPFLGKFPVTQRRKVVFFSGESGDATIFQTVKRVCNARGQSELPDNIVWYFALPPLTHPDIRSLLTSIFSEHGISGGLVIVDPFYLSLSGSKKSVSATSMFEMANPLVALANACREWELTPLLVHHSTKGLQRRDVMQIQHLAYSGSPEFARQWLLVNRPKPYKNGHHELLLNAGGSAGQSSLWKVTIEEGYLENDFSGREWDVTVEAANVDKEAQVGSQQRNADNYLKALDEVSQSGEWASCWEVAKRAGIANNRVRPIIDTLANVVEKLEAPCKVRRLKSE